MRQGSGDVEQEQGKDSSALGVWGESDGNRVGTEAGSRHGGGGTTGGACRAREVSRSVLMGRPSKQNSRIIHSFYISHFQFLKLHVISPNISFLIGVFSTK